MRRWVLSLVLSLFLISATALPFTPDSELNGRVLSYYRFNELPLAGSVMLDSRNGKNGTYPSDSTITQRSWAVGGELRNQGLNLGDTSLKNSPISLRDFRTSLGISFSFLLETNPSERKQTVLKVVNANNILLAHLFLENSQLSLSSDFFYEVKVSNRRLIPGALHNIILSININSIVVYVDGLVDLHQMVYLDPWEEYERCDVFIGKDPATLDTHLIGVFDELMVFNGPVHAEDPVILYNSYLQGSLPTCSESITVSESFEGFPNGTSLEGLGSDIGPCSWGSTWSTNKGVIFQDKLTFNDPSAGLHATRFLSLSTNTASLAFTGSMLDLCRVTDPNEPLDDTVGYCRAGGKIISMSLCANDGYCITVGVATDRRQFLYRLGYFSDPLRYVGSISRPMKGSYPNGVYFRVEVSEAMKLTIYYGSNENATSVLLTDRYLPANPPLSQYNILRLIVGTRNNEPGVMFDNLHVYTAPSTEAPLQCDSGEYLADGACRSCPGNTTSPLGSVSMSQCVCSMGAYLDLCLGDPLCEEGVGRDDFSFPRFTDLSLIRMIGDASIATGNSIRLTPSASVKSSQVFFLNPVDLYRMVDWFTEETSFSTQFVFLINENAGYESDGPGADGLAFIMTSALPTAMPAVGGGLGYTNLSPSVVVEFDTWYNSDAQDINGNHVGINVNGDPRSVVSSAVTPVFTNGQPWYCWIDYDAAHVVLEVRLSQSNQRPSEPIVRLFESVANILASPIMYVGFSASTGHSYSGHYLLSWSFSSASQGACLPCYQGTYKDQYGNGQCKECPYGSYTSESGSDSVEDCKCYPGFESNGSGECIPCPVDYYSSDYGTPCLPCRANSGTWNNTGMMYCDCKGGYYQNETGDCVDVNECGEGAIECRNGGTCNNVAGSFECVCLPGWSGDFCERDVNECLYLPCWNNGYCSNTPGSFFCTCPPGWTGTHCELDINECETSNSCSPNATCTNTVGSFTCVCGDGFVGDGFDCHTPRGPTFLTPLDNDIMGRMVLVKWVPELHFIPLQYVVEIDVKPFGSNFAIDEQRFAYGAVEQALLEGLTPNSEMRMRIKAINSFGASPASNIISVTTKPSYPERPTLKATPAPNNHILLEWVPGNANGATVNAYLVRCFRNDTAGTEISETLPATQTSVVIDELVPGVNYVATVTAQSNYGNSEQSAGVPVYISPVPTAGPTTKPTSTQSPSATPSVPDEKPNNGGMIAGLVIGIIAFMAILIGAALYYRRKMMNKDGAIRLGDDPSASGRRERRSRSQKKGKDSAPVSDPAGGDLSLLNPAEGDEGDINVNTGFDEDAEDIEEN